MKTKINYFLRSVFFLLGFMIILTLISPIFVPKNNSQVSGMRNIKANGILSEEKNTIDVLFLGDSEAYSSFSPMLMWNEEGFTSYVSAIPGSSLNEVIHLFEQALENQKPKIVVLETNVIFRHFSPFSSIKKSISLYFPILEYHDRWKTLTMDDFHEKPNYTWKDDLKGFSFNKKIQPTSNKDYMKKDNRVTTISKVNEYMIHEIIKICQQNDIQLVFVSAPSSKNWNNAKHEATKLFAQQNDIDFLDMNQFIQEIGIDWNQDTRDAGDHLNYYGAEKVSSYLASYLKNSFELEDRRMDIEFFSWQLTYENYQKIVSKN
ncbi:MAG: hypothetical protein ACI4U3_01710 [Traorella sp.]